MQIRKYDQSVKISLSLAALNRIIHPTYSEDKLAFIQPFLVKVLRKCKKNPFEIRGVSIVADPINSWYTLSGNMKDVRRFIDQAITLELLA